MSTYGRCEKCGEQMPFIGFRCDDCVLPDPGAESRLRRFRDIGGEGMDHDWRDY